MTTSPDPYSSIVGESVSRPTAWPAGFCPFPVFSQLRCSCLLDCTRGAGDRVLARQQDDAAHQDEDQEQHGRDEVETEPERGDDAAEAEALEEEQDPGEDRNPPEPARQDAAADHEHACREGKEAAEYVPDAVQAIGHQVQRVGHALIVVEPERRELRAEQAEDTDVADGMQGNKERSAS